MNRVWWQKPFLSASLLVLVWLAWRLPFLAVSGFPVPVFHDEFSYLLGADTFAHGRLANPTHPLAPFFESPHELMRPTYASKYPPGLAMFLALGQTVFGHPFYGILITNVLMLFTFSLMLFAWVEPQWAWVGSAVLLICVSPGMYWTDSYFGSGPLAAAGGALVLLGIAICRKSGEWYGGAIFAAGALLLFWTRPFEGGICTLVILILFARDLWRNRRTGTTVAALALLIAGAAWTCWDNEAVTHHPLRLPYMEHDRQYNVTPVLWMLPLRQQPHYDQPRLAAQHGVKGAEEDSYDEFHRGNYDVVHGFALAFRTLYMGHTILLTLILPFAWADPLYRRMAVVVGALTVALTCETFHFAHYAAPGWAAAILMIAIWVSRVWSWRLSSFPAGKVLAFAVVLSPASRPLLHYVEHIRKPAPDAQRWGIQRAELIDSLSKRDKRQLIIVRYPYPAWRVRDEWVYNSADIDAQRVIFAHDLGAVKDRELLAYYPDRDSWLLTFDPVSGQYKLSPYTENAISN